MSRSRSAGLVTALILVGTGQVWAMEHIGVSRTDQFLLCVRSLLQKPVFRATAVFRGPGQEIEIPCGSSREQLLEELRGSRTDRDPEEIRVLEMPEVVFLCPFRVWVKSRWKKLSIVPKAQNWRAMPGSRGLSDEEREGISNVILREARTVPLVTPMAPGRDGETATIEVMLWLDSHRLAPGSAESVVGILGESGGAGRLIYGEMREGKYEILWDSPLFSTGFLGLSYQDMDGDGTEEVVVGADEVMGGGPNKMGQLSVWDRKGREITRQEPCEISLLSGYTKEGAACPIQGTWMEIDPREGGKSDILVRGRPGWYEDVDSQKVFRYRLLNGRYVVAPDAHKKPTKEPRNSPSL